MGAAPVPTPGCFGLRVFLVNSGFGPHAAILRANSWLCPLESLLDNGGPHGIKPGWRVPGEPLPTVPLPQPQAEPCCTQFSLASVCPSCGCLSGLASACRHLKG